MSERITTAPRGLAILAVVGPSLIWCAEYIGSGEVILATRTGAILGTSVLWAIVLAIVLKSAIGMAGAHWAAVTGEGMIDLFDRMPGPRHWLVWLVLAVQLPAGVVSIGALARVAGLFLHSTFPLPNGAIIWGLAASLFAVAVAWTGRFSLLKAVMSGLVAIIVVGVLYVALTVTPSWLEVGRGFLGLQPQVIPSWAQAQLGGAVSPWHEILPLMGWSAGGFASQVWYGYWVLGTGYGMAAGRGWGRPADAAALASLDAEDAGRLRGWCRVVRADASLACLVGVSVTSCFCLAGAGVLRPAQLVPSGTEVAVTCSNIFSAHWGRVGGMLFLAAGSAALLSTLVGVLSGWPRMLADCVRIVYPPFGQLPPARQLHGFLLFFVATNLLAVLFFSPVKMIQVASQLDGILLTPVQAAAILVAFFVILPRLVGTELGRSLRPGKLLLALLVLAALVFGSLGILIIPGSLASIIRS